jgi:uncharacterized protein (DUF983 family)
MAISPQPQSLAEAVFNHKCPQCRQGDMYKTSAFNLPKYAAMHTHCENCGFKFEMEPGFFYGAMYFSYAFSIATIVISFFTIYFFFDNPETSVYLYTICSLIVLMMPLSFRYSRTLMLYLFGGVVYQKQPKQMEKHS